MTNKSIPNDTSTPIHRYQARMVAAKRKRFWRYAADAFFASHILGVVCFSIFGGLSVAVGACVLLILSLVALLKSHSVKKYADSEVSHG